MGLKIIKGIRYAVSMQVLVPKGVNMTKEQQSILDKLEVLYGVNWWDESDYSERA